MKQSILIGIIMIGLYGLGMSSTSAAGFEESYNRLMHRPIAVREHDRYRRPNYGRPAPIERTRKVIWARGYKYPPYHPMPFSPRRR